MKLEKILDFLKDKYKFHSVILYGSRAGDKFRSDSDYDFLCIRKEGKRIREIIKFENITIDLIVDDEEIAKRPNDVLYLWQSKILTDEKGFAKALVDSTLARLSHSPEPLSLSRITQRKKQILDSLIYIQQNDILGDYRRNDLLAKLLPLYCDFAHIWDLGDKHTLTWLEKNDSKTFELFRLALKKESSYSNVEELVLHLCDFKV
ncbi:MAG: nucleotidyltransferase domain-containing protein [Bacteriovorax sp.]|nr:nucleotidyltransferase domain-containing protein [Bacteriovorax sp.]